MKTITSNARTQDQVSILHLFEFDLIPVYDEITGVTQTEQITSIFNNVLTRDPSAGGLTYWLGIWSATPSLTKYDIRELIIDSAITNNDLGNSKLYLTDHDIFVSYGGNTYTPVSISFDKLKEDISTQTNSVSLTMDNITSELSSKAFNYEWRGNPTSITRVLFTPPSETPIDNNTYEFGYGDNLETLDGDIYPLINIDTYTKDVYNLFNGYINTFSATEQSINVTLSTKFIYWQRPFPTRTYDQKDFSGVINVMTQEAYWGRVKP